MAMRLHSWQAMRERQLQEYLASPAKRELDDAYLRAGRLDRLANDAIRRGDDAQLGRVDEMLRTAREDIERLKEKLDRELKQTKSRRSR